MQPRVLGLLAVAGALMVSACAAPGGAVSAPAAVRLEAAGTVADVLLLGELHDDPDHQRWHRETVETLAQRGRLAALALEMAERGASTAGLPADAGEAAVREALRWDDQAWPWAAYRPAVMAAARAGVPVLGANLPAAQMREAMADIRLDGQLPGPALKAQQQLIRSGHCELLPESQISPMTRIQVARDISMARTITQAALPGKTVVLLAGSGHVNRELGVPQHLPDGMNIKAVLLRAGLPPPMEPGARAGTGKAPAFDVIWTTPAVPQKDYCAELKDRFKPS